MIPESGFSSSSDLQSFSPHLCPPPGSFVPPHPLRTSSEEPQTASVRRRVLLALLGFVVALGFERGKMRGEFALLKGASWKGEKTHETKDAFGSA